MDGLHLPESLGHPRAIPERSRQRRRRHQDKGQGKHKKGKDTTNKTKTTEPPKEVASPLDAARSQTASAPAWCPPLRALGHPSGNVTGARAAGAS